MGFNLEKLKALSIPASKEFLKNLEYRVKNKNWIKRSTRIALKMRKALEWDNAKLPQDQMTSTILMKKLNLSYIDFWCLYGGTWKMHKKAYDRIESALDAIIAAKKKKP